jgi:hypothetical protein
VRDQVDGRVHVVRLLRRAQHLCFLCWLFCVGFGDGFRLSGVGLIDVAARNRIPQPIEAPQTRQASTSACINHLTKQKQKQASLQVPHAPARPS